MPPRYATASYKEVPEKIRDHLKQMAKTKKGIYIWGECGTGKTHVVYGIMKHCIEKRIPARIYNSPELLDIIRHFYGQRYEYRDDELRQLKDYQGLVIIDDIGAEKPTAWVAETFYKILNVRYELMLPTIFTSNLSLDQLAEKNGDRISSRIAEMCHVVRLAGEDKRLTRNRN